MSSLSHRRTIYCSLKIDNVNESKSNERHQALFLGEPKQDTAGVQTGFLVQQGSALLSQSDQQQPFFFFQRLIRRR